ncbi:MAG TPA: hypothetical protein VEF04_23540 [Blastocatellia bacterium]|nr:hypothetical protein [Blastocatellia bacterium]
MMEYKFNLEMLKEIQQQCHDELATVESLLNHHREEAMRLQNRMLQLREMTKGLDAFVYGLEHSI